MSEAARPFDPGEHDAPKAHPRGRRPGEPSIFDDDPEERGETVPPPRRGRRPGEPSIFDDDVNFIGPTYPRLLPAGRRPGEPSILDEVERELEAERRAEEPRVAPDHADAALETTANEADASKRELTVSKRSSKWREDRPSKREQAEPARSKFRIARPPEERQCRHLDAVDAGPARRCEHWTRKIGEGVFDDYCQAHSPDDDASKRRHDRSAAGARASAAARAKPEAGAPRSLYELFAKPFTSQDEVSNARSTMISAMFDPDARRRVSPAQVAAGLAGLKAMSEHIERYGATKGAEGGHSYMRLIPGVDICEYEDPADAALTGPDMDRIMAGIEQDKRNGLSPPSDIADAIERYCGRKVRRREPSRHAAP